MIHSEGLQCENESNLGSSVSNDTPSLRAPEPKIEPLSPVAPMKGEEEPQRSSLRRNKTSSRSRGSHPKENNRRRAQVEAALNKSLTAIDHDIFPTVARLYRSKSLEQATTSNLDQHFARKAPQRSRSSSGSSLRSGESTVSSRKRLKRRLKGSTKVQTTRNVETVEREAPDISSSQVPRESSSPGRYLRRSQSSIETQSTRSSSKWKQRTPSSSKGSVEDDDASRRSKASSRGRLRRVRSADGSSIASTGTAGSAESKKSSLINDRPRSSRSNSRSKKKRSSSSVKRKKQRSKGDKAPVTPTRGPPTPCTSDLELSPPRVYSEDAPPPKESGEDKTEKPPSSSGTIVVSTSKMRRKAHKYRPNKVTRSKSDSVVKVMDIGGEVRSSPICRRKPQENCASSLKSASLVVLSSMPLPPLVPQSTPTLKDQAATDVISDSPRPTLELSSEPVVSDSIDVVGSTLATTKSSKKEKEGKRRKFPTFQKLTKSFSLGSRKNAVCALALKKSNGDQKSTTSPSIGYPDKYGFTDDSTVHSSMENTVSTASTVSTTQSDLSSEEYALQPVTPVSLKRLSTVKTFSRLLSRLRTDFDKPGAEEEEEDQAKASEKVAQGARRAEVSNSLMNHMVSAGSELREVKVEGEEDSTMVSNLDAFSPCTRALPLRSRSASQSAMKGTTRLARSGSCERRVGFASVIVREYERSIGDNPAVSSGAPIGLGWNYTDYLQVDVDIYESRVRKPGPRTRKDFFLTPQKRFHILLDEWGYTVLDICKAKDLAAQIRYQRQVSIFGEPTQQPQQHSHQRTGRDSSAAPATNVNKVIKGPYSKQKGSMKLTKMPKADNRWDASCPAAPGVNV